MTTYIFVVFLDDAALGDNLSDLSPGYHQLGAEHLPQCVGEKQHLSLGRLSHLGRYILRVSHIVQSTLFMDAAQAFPHRHPA